MKFTNFEISNCPWMGVSFTNTQSETKNQNVNINDRYLSKMILKLQNSKTCNRDLGFFFFPLECAVQNTASDD